MSRNYTYGNGNDSNTGKMKPMTRIETRYLASFPLHEKGGGLITESFKGKKLRRLIIEIEHYPVKSKVQMTSLNKRAIFSRIIYIN